jgi:hypothetical protein
LFVVREKVNSRLKNTTSIEDRVVVYETV